MQKIMFMLALAGPLAVTVPAGAQPFPLSSNPPFNATLSNNTPLAFGMPIDVAAGALGVPLAWVSGSRGNEIYLAIRDVGGGGFFERRDRLFLQFRHGRLTGWKGDWGRNWMWR
ncbi:MAG: hypothetical protein JWQ94_4409 [Tardiphaga sp.]|jgi:hypothetical protein|nr:hypothetical protein [Tardiphaga sp.]